MGVIPGVGKGGDSNQGNKWEGAPAIFVDFCIIKKKSEKKSVILPRTWTPFPIPIINFVIGQGFQNLTIGKINVHRILTRIYIF